MLRIFMKYFTFIALPLIAAESFAFENAKVLPRGIRNINLKSVYTQTSMKRDSSGAKVALALPLLKPLKFNDILKGEKGIKKTQLAAFLASQNFSNDMALGEFKADLNAKIHVVAPVVAYGITDKLTLALAAPVYSASTDVEMGFVPNARSDEFVGKLAAAKINNVKNAIEAAQKLTAAVKRLNDKLEDNGYDRLGAWSKTSLGDITLATKYAFISGSKLRLASSFGFVAPTGRTDDPDILTDLPTGDGQWDIFAGIYADQQLSSEIFLNQNLKYTNQLPGRKPMRLKTADEPIEVAKEDLKFKLGDKVDAELSVQMEQVSGLVAGIGAAYFRKFADRYYADASAVKKELKSETDQTAIYGKVRLGYSSLPAFKRGKSAVPMNIILEYRKQYSSKNIAMTDFTQIDFNVYF